MRRELIYFVLFSALFIYVLYARRDVQNGARPPLPRPAHPLWRSA